MEKSCFPTIFMASPLRRLVRHVRLACLLFSVFISTCVSASAVLAAPGISIGLTDSAGRGRFGMHVLPSLRGSFDHVSYWT